MQLKDMHERIVNVLGYMKRVEYKDHKENNALGNLQFVEHL